MHILFGSAHPYLPQIAGGSQSNTHETVGELLKRGHKVSVLAGLTKDGLVGARGRIMLKLLGRKVARDNTQGYPVYRSWFAWEGVSDVIKSARPDIVIAQSGSVLRLAEPFVKADVPVILYMHNVEFEDHGGDLNDFRHCTFLSNSEFTRERYRNKYGIDSVVVNPLFQPDRYKTTTTRERVLFINPHPLKGLDVAVTLASAFPEIPFDFVESWTLSEDQRRTLMKSISPLRNVTLHLRTTDMRLHYRHARIVLIPSQWEETWGRVASEAHYSGIPVLGSGVGGLVEAVGPGGVLLPREAPSRDWADALRRLWSDTDYYRSMSDAALDYAMRPAIDRHHQIELLESIMARVVRDGAQS